MEELSGVLEAQPSMVRRHLGFWVSQGVLREQPTDSFTVVEYMREAGRGRGQGEERRRESEREVPCFSSAEDMDDSDSAMATAEEQKESDLQVLKRIKSDDDYPSLSLSHTGDVVLHRRDVDQPREATAGENSHHVENVHHSGTRIHTRMLSIRAQSVPGPEGQGTATSVFRGCVPTQQDWQLITIIKLKISG